MTQPNPPTPLPCPLSAPQTALVAGGCVKAMADVAMDRAASAAAAKAAVWTVGQVAAHPFHQNAARYGRPPQPGQCSSLAPSPPPPPPPCTLDWHGSHASRRPSMSSNREATFAQQQPMLPFIRLPKGIAPPYLGVAIASHCGQCR